MLHKTTKAIQIKYAKISKTGKRSNNEDAVKVITTPDEPRWMGIVCDGMGGHAMGEIASETAIETIARYWQETTSQPDTEEKVRKACHEASAALDSKSQTLHNVQMGTTMVMASIEGTTLTIAHIGDSRCYLRRSHPQNSRPRRTQFRMGSSNKMLLLVQAGNSNPRSNTVHHKEWRHNPHMLRWNIQKYPARNTPSPHYGRKDTRGNTRCPRLSIRKGR